MAAIKPTLKKLTFLTLFAMFAVTLFAPLKVNALSGSDFKAGKIIDDLVFFNKNSMTPAQIQAFLNAKLPACWRNHPAYTSSSSGITYYPPFTCLNEYQENPTTKENNIGRFNPNGSPYNVPGGKSAAQIIWDAGQTYNINPQVLIVMLQKEQGLITDDWPIVAQYNTAMGYACPDNGPNRTANCNASYFGFYNQLDSAAWQLRRYITNPNEYNFKGGVTRYIQYNPDPGCGGSNVYLENAATAALYNYTPYQPNAGTLALMNDSTAGGTTTCGAYGNRNFFWYFNKWFGSTTYGNLIRTAGGGVYFIENGTKRAFPSEIVFLSYSYQWSSVSTITLDMMALIPDGTPMAYNTNFREGRLVSVPSQGVFLIDHAVKRPIVSELAFLSYSYKWSDVLPISAAEMALIPDGTPMAYNIHYRNGRLIKSTGGIYLIDNGAKRAFPNEAVFLSYSYKWSDVVTVSPAELTLIPDGTTMTSKL